MRLLCRKVFVCVCVYIYSLVWEIGDLEGGIIELKYWSACFAVLSLCLDALFFFQLIDTDVKYDLIICCIFTIGNRRKHEKFVFW